MQDEPKIIGMERLSKRYDMFPVLLASSPSLQEISQRNVMWGRFSDWLHSQVTEAFGYDRFPDWGKNISRWTITLIDGRRFPFTDAERAEYLQQIAIHQKTQELIGGIIIQRESYKTGK